MTPRIASAVLAAFGLAMSASEFTDPAGTSLPFALGALAWGLLFTVLAMVPGKGEGE